VRGTEFRSSVEPSGDRGTTETLEGLVAVAGSGAEVSVPADYGTRVERDAAPRPPLQLLPPPDLQTIPGTNGASRLVLQWPAITGAAGYRVQLAPDAEFHSFVADAVSIAAQIDLPAPADGNYWLRVRSIDNLGLEGRDAVRTLVQRLLPAAPALAGPLPDASIVGDGAAFAWADLGPGMRYRVQIARDAGFTDLLVERDAIEAAQLDVEHVPAGRYFWRVAALNDRGESGEWSPAQVFTQRRHAPTPDEPAFPARELQLKWQPQEGVRYRVQIARDPDFRTMSHDETRDEPSLTMRRPRPGIYYARIQTIYPDGGTAPFGDARKFDVPVPLWLKILLPLAVAAAALA
jgi:predicted phage tail protein